MLPHYLSKIKVQICDVTNVMFDEMKRISSGGSADNAIVKFTTVARNVRLFIAHTHAL